VRGEWAGEGGVPAQRERLAGDTALGWGELDLEYHRVGDTERLCWESGHG